MAQEQAIASPHLPDEAAIARTVEALRARNIHVIVTNTGEEAHHALIQLLPEGAEICDSTSETLDAIGFTAFVRGNPRFTNLHDGYAAEPDLAKRNDLRRRASIADYFIGSVQAIAETGEVFVASATGSQLAPYAYAAKHVIWVVGVQKIVPTFDAAMQRVRGHTLARHDQWLAEMGRAPTPIGKLGIIEHESQAGRITLILVKELLGW
jgi:L-lactate utilization protein LutC